MKQVKNTFADLAGMCVNRMLSFVIFMKGHRTEHLLNSGILHQGKGHQSPL